MPMPWTYRHPEKEWRGFLDDIAEILGTASSNVAYTAAEGVLHAFRDRLTPEMVMVFSESLPAVPRALFLQGWHMEPPQPWADRDTVLHEVQSLRKAHNLVGNAAVEAVSFALHRAVGPDALRKVLAVIGPEAEGFWAIDGYSDEELAFRFR
jgi:uncharacterized protein (DUF2267 family)